MDTQTVRNGATAGSRMPTEADPDAGHLLLEGVPFEAVRWVEEDGAHVVASTEFDLRGIGTAWDDAFMSFWGAAFDLFDYLADLIADERATEHEHETTALLGTRCVAVMQARSERLEKELRERQRRRLALNLRRQARSAADRQQSWDPDRETRPNLSTLLPA